MKTIVETCKRLSITDLKNNLITGDSGILKWFSGETETGRIRFHIGETKPISGITLSYSIIPDNKKQKNICYEVELARTNLVWGGERYWFICPLSGCVNRVGCLYLPPGKIYFGCRQCYNLAYGSQYESNYIKKFHISLVNELQNLYPGICPKDIKACQKGKSTKYLKIMYLERVFKEFEKYDRYLGYLTADELCSKTGLTTAQLNVLQSARLILPDTNDGRYRPKLIGWGRKLVFLLKQGWNIEKIKIWARERWNSENPKAFPLKEFTPTK